MTRPGTSKAAPEGLAKTKSSLPRPEHCERSSTHGLDLQGLLVRHTIETLSFVKVLVLSSRVYWNSVFVPMGNHAKMCQRSGASPSTEQIDS